MLTITTFKQEVERLNFELKGMAKSVCMLNIEVDKHDGILSMENLKRIRRDLDILEDHHPQILCLFLLLIKKTPRCLE